MPVELAVKVGRTHMTIRETLALGPGSIGTLNRLSGEPGGDPVPAPDPEAPAPVPAPAPNA